MGNCGIRWRSRGGCGLHGELVRVDCGLTAGSSGSAWMTDIDPATGLREFSCGPASDEHAGGTPGRNRAVQPFHRVQGGFLSVRVSRRGDRAVISLKHHGVHGKVFNEYRQAVE